MKVASIEHHVFLKFPPHSLSMMFSSWLKKKLELHLVAFCYTSELSFLHGAPVTFSGEWCKKSKTWAAGVFIVQFSSVTQLCLTLCDPWTAAHQASLSITSSQSLLKLMSVDDAIQPSHPLFSSSPVFNLSQHQGLFHLSQLFSSGGQSIGASASASVLPMNIQD